MSVSVLPRDSVGPPSIDYNQERSTMEPKESPDMEKGPQSTDELIESLMKGLQGLNLKMPAKKAAAPKKAAMDDVDGLLGRGVDQPREHDEWNSYSYSGSSYSPSNPSMSPMYQPSPASSSGYGPQSPQSLLQFSPRSQTSPSNSMRSTGSSEHLCTGSPGSPSQSGSSLSSSSLSLSQRMLAPPVTASVAVSGHSGLPPTQSYGFPPTFDGFSEDVLFRENPPSLSSQSSGSNRSSGGSEEVNSRQPFFRGTSLLEDFMQVTAPERVQAGIPDFPEQPAFLGEQPVQVPGGYSTSGMFSSIPPPHAEYQPHQAALTQSASQEIMDKQKIMDFLKGPPSLEIDNAPPVGCVSGRAEGHFSVGEQVQVVPDHANDLFASLDFGYQQDFPDPMRSQYALGPKSLPPPATSSATQPVLHQTPAVPLRQPLVPPRQSQVSSQAQVSSRPQVCSRPQTAQGSQGTQQRQTALTRTPGASGMLQAQGFLSLPTLAPGKRSWVGEGEAPGPRKTLKREWSQYFQDPEDTDLHVLAELTEEDMEQQMEFIETFVSNCCQDQLNAFNMEKKTPLYVAVGNLNFKMVNLLLQKGARTDIMSSDKNRLANEQKIEQSVLHLACEKGSPEMVSMFVTYGANVNSARFCDGRLTPLMVAVQKYATESENRSNFEKIVLFLIKNNAKLDLTEKLNKKTALMMAVETGEARLIQLMLEEIGAGRTARDLINLPNGQGNTCLHIAAGRQNQTPQERSALMEILVKFGGDNNAKNREGYTPNDLGGRAPMRMISSSIQQRMSVSQSRAAIPNLAQINNCI